MAPARGFGPTLANAAVRGCLPLCCGGLEVSDAGLTAASVTIGEVVLAETGIEDGIGAATIAGLSNLPSNSPLLMPPMSAAALVCSPFFSP